MKSLNLSKFKKMKEDGKATTLKSPEGHKIIIAHHALSPSLRKQLAALPHKYADGGDTEEGTMGPTRPAPSLYERVDNALSLPGEQEDDALHQWQAGMNAPQNSSPVAASDAKLSISPEERAGLDSVKENEGAVPSDSPAPAIAQNEPEQNTLAPEAARAPAAVSPHGEAESPEPPQQTEAPQAAPEDQTYQKSFQDYKQAHQQQFAQEDAAFAHDLANGHITPETYHDLYAKKDTLGKIGTLFGLMLSGIGSGLSGQPNAVIAAMNSEIQNDLEAQLKSKENAQNFIKLNQSQNLNEATVRNMEKTGQLTEAQAKGALAEANLKSFTMANLQANQAAFHNQSQMVAKMPEGPQKEQAKAALAMMGSAMTAENARIGDLASSKIALLNSMNGGQGGMNSTALKMMGQPELARDQEEKTIPGVGRAQIPVPQNKRDEIEAMNTLDYKSKDLLGYIKQNKGTLSPEKRRVAEQKAEEMVNYYNNSIKGGVLTEGRLKWLDGQINKNPTSIVQDLMGNTARLQEIQSSNAERKNIILRQLGVKVPQSQASSGQEGAQSTSKSGKPIVFKDGKWHYK